MNRPTDLRAMTLYSIYIRAWGGTFRAVEQDLKRIRDLGVDAIWLLPIHPTGKERRLGTLGSPYAIADYRSVNPEFGTLEDFIQLCNAAHGLGLKVLIDVVYNHTAPDSWLRWNHPEWFYHKSNGDFGNHVGEWSDIIDLDYNQPELWDYQIETLKQWAKWVDGFRCDVAPLIPLEFWKRARREVAEVRPDCIWLCESVEPDFIRNNRARGMISLSDCELYQAFDASYDYDVYGDFLAYALGETDLSDYVRALNRQEAIYPGDYVKLRFLENHDRPRASHLFPDERIHENWTAWMFFQKGMALLYAGQECRANHRPDLFNADPITDPVDEALAARLKALIQMKKDPIFTLGAYSIAAHPHDLLCANYQMNNETLTGVFSLRGQAGILRTNLPDGAYADLITGETVRVESGLLSCKGRPMIFKAVQEGAEHE